MWSIKEMVISSLYVQYFLIVFVLPNSIYYIEFNKSAAFGMRDIMEGWPEVDLVYVNDPDNIL